MRGVRTGDRKCRKTPLTPDRFEAFRSMKKLLTPGEKPEQEYYPGFLEPQAAAVKYLG